MASQRESFSKSDKIFVVILMDGHLVIHKITKCPHFMKFERPLLCSQEGPVLSRINPVPIARFLI
jgi:hypothetical protein